MKLPTYEIASTTQGIAHIGVGGFHRAHQAVHTDDALAAEGGDWRILGANLRSREILKVMKIDEARHADHAEHAGARKLPPPIPGVMALASKVMKTIAYRL